MDQCHSEWRYRVAESHGIDVWVSTGSIFNDALAENVVQQYADHVGLCVSVTKTKYIYAGGSEKGLRVGLRNYPRFPSDIRELWTHAYKIGRAVTEELQKGSFMIEEIGGETTWFSRRGDI